MKFQGITTTTTTKNLITYLVRSFPTCHLIRFVILNFPGHITSKLLVQNLTNPLNPISYKPQIDALYPCVPQRGYFLTPIILRVRQTFNYENATCVAGTSRQSKLL